MTDDSIADSDSLEIPSSGRTAVLRVGIISTDETLVARLKEALTNHNVPFDVFASEEESHGAAPRFWARIREAGVPGELALIVGDADISRATGHPLAMHLFARKDVAQLVSVLEVALGRERARIERPSFLGDSDTIQQVRARAEYVARFPDVSVLVLGETGTGKELVAQEIHRLTVGNRGPFVPVDCASIPTALFESELFGHEAGSIAGARASRTGLFEQAAGGTLFLDEIGEMPLALQPKLLRALETRRFKRVGSNVEIPLTARIVSATSRLVTGERHDGTLRRDLYYRLSSFTIALPALRDRTDDIAVLTTRFIERFAERYRLPPRELRDDAIAALAAHTWPGNVRELRAVAEQLAMAAGVHGSVGVAEVNALLLERRPQTSEADATMMSPLAEEVISTSRPMTMVSPSGTSRLASTLRPTTAAGATLKELERDIVLEALSQSNGNLSRTARKLGIARSTLRHKLRRYGIETARAQDED